MRGSRLSVKKDEIFWKKDERIKIVCEANKRGSRESRNNDERIKIAYEKIWEYQDSLWKKAERNKIVYEKMTRARLSAKRREDEGSLWKKMKISR